IQTTFLKNIIHVLCCAACTGRIPRELGALTRLEALSLGGNALTGEGCNFLMIPIESIFSIFVDSVPLTRWRPLTSLKTEIYFMFDPLKPSTAGRIPPELGKLAALIKLHLFENQLSGNIPPELGKLTALTTLSLESNQLTGEQFRAFQD
ncbi:unnamed protein product, partial [Scytosiphon promiscuus]